MSLSNPKVPEQDSSKGLNLHSPIGIVAGNGQFPVELVHGAAKQGVSVVAALHTGEAEKELEDMVESSIWIRVGQIGKVVKFFKKKNVRQVFFLGGIQRKSLLKHFRPDLLGVKVLSRVQSVEDDKILRGVADEFENQGFEVLDPSLLLEGHKIKQR